MVSVGGLVRSTKIPKNKSTVRLLKIVMIPIAITCLMIFPPWESVIAWISPLPDTVQEQVDDAVEHGLDGIIVYVDRTGTEPGFYSAGWKDRELKIPADPHALFKIGSISKLYIAAVTAMLISDGKLSLDDTVAQYFPGLVGRIENADQISLRMLLQHRSGIPDWIDDPEFPWATSLTEVNQYLDLVLDDPAEFEPGSRSDYSNTNYLLIGNILDQTLGYNHQQYIQSEILDPLGLTHTFGVLSVVDSDQVSSGYNTEHDWNSKNV